MRSQAACLRVLRRWLKAAWRSRVALPGFRRQRSFCQTSIFHAIIPELVTLLQSIKAHPQPHAHS